MNPTEKDSVFNAFGGGPYEKVVTVLYSKWLNRNQPVPDPARTDSSQARLDSDLARYPETLAKYYADVIGFLDQQAILLSLEAIEAFQLDASELNLPEKVLDVLAGRRRIAGIVPSHLPGSCLASFFQGGTAEEKHRVVGSCGVSDNDTDHRGRAGDLTILTDAVAASGVSDCSPV